MLTAVAGLCPLNALGAEPPRAPRRVLEILQRNLEVTPGYVAFQTAFRAAVPDGDHIELSVETFDAVRAGDMAYRAAFRSWLASEFSTAPPELVVAVGEIALAFVAEQGSMPWPGVPVVFAAVDERSAAVQRLPPRTTGITNRYPIKETLDLALQLFPDARRVVLWGGVSPSDCVRNEIMRGEVAPYAHHLEVVDLVGLPTPELLDRVRALPAGTILLGTSYNLDPAGRSWDGRDFIRTLAAVGTAPVFTVHAHLLGSGMVGGVVVDAGETGQRAMRLVVRLLGGEVAAAIPVERSGPYRTLVDARELGRWRVPEWRAPPGAEILFREVSPWHRYRWHFLAALSVLTVQALLISGLLVARRNRRAAERVARENLAQIAHLNRTGAVGELTVSLAHELNTPLGAALNNAQAARRFMARMPDAPGSEEVKACLDDIAVDVRRARTVLQRIRGALRLGTAHEARLDLAGVIHDAVRLIEVEARDRGISISVDAPDGLPPVSGDGGQLVQVVLNLLMNAIDALGSMPPEHRRISVRAEAVGDGVAIDVVDTGPGIAPSQMSRVFEPFFTTKAGGLGLGLAISRSIVEAHGGRLKAAAGPDGGTAFQVFLPARPRLAAHVH